MSGPAIHIELPLRPSDPTVQLLRDRLKELSTRFRDGRFGEYVFSVDPRRLGIDVVGVVGTAASDDRPFEFVVRGPSFGDAELFDIEHKDRDFESKIGFRPTQRADLFAVWNDPVDHVAAAVLAAEVMDVIGGVAELGCYVDQNALIRGLPGLVHIEQQPRPLPGVMDSMLIFCTQEFLRAWTAEPGFHLRK